MGAATQVCYKQLHAAGVSFRKSSFYYSYSHNKYWIVDGRQVVWSTGNWSPSDYPEGDAGTGHDNTYPPYGSPNWWKANRDFTVYTDSAPAVASFSALFDGDWSAPATYPWDPTYDVYCGY